MGDEGDRPTRKSTSLSPRPTCSRQRDGRPRGDEAATDGRQRASFPFCHLAHRITKLGEGPLEALDFEAALREEMWCRRARYGGVAYLLSEERGLLKF